MDQSKGGGSIIQIDEQYRVTTDPHQWTIQITYRQGLIFIGLWQRTLAGVLSGIGRETEFNTFLFEPVRDVAECRRVTGEAFPDKLSQHLSRPGR